MVNEIIHLNLEYKNLINSIKNKVTAARLRAVLAVNLEQIKLYWEIGDTIIERQKCTQWGSKLLEQISHDLQIAFPDMKGFSRSNVHNMKLFAEAYPNQQIVQQTVGQLPL